MKSAGAMHDASTDGGMQMAGGAEPKIPANLLAEHLNHAGRDR
jgi:hypothetical protein